MIQTLKSLLGFGPKVDVAELIKNGAMIIDVRSKGEYSSGHIKGSLNIPVDQISSSLKKFKSKDQLIITCFSLSMRSG